MHQTSPYLALEVDGLFIDAWTSYTASSDLFTPCDGFSLVMNVGATKSRAFRKMLDELRAKITAGAVVKLHASDGGKVALQGMFIADAREVENAYGDGTTFNVQGRDLAALLTDSAVMGAVYKPEQRLVDLARKAVQPWSGTPWSLTVKTDANGARNVRTGMIGRASTRNMRERAEALGIPAAKLSSKILAGIDNGTIDATTLVASKRSGGNGVSPAQIAQIQVQHANPQVGETVWDFLDRHCKRLSVLPRMGPDGTLVLAGIDYDQKPLYSLVRRIDDGRSNNVVSGGERLDTARVYNRVRVVSSGKNRRGGPRTGIVAEVLDLAADVVLPHEKLLVVQDDSIPTREEAENRAYREAAKSLQGAHVLNYVVHGHGQDGRLYATDTVCNVWDEVAGAKGTFYVVGRTFTCDAQSGPRTTLRLVPKGSIVLGDPSG